MDTYSRFTESLFGAVPGAIRIIVLILVALIVAAIVKKLVVKGLAKLAPVAKLSKWGLVKPTQDEKSLIKGFGQFAYFLVSSCSSYQPFFLVLEYQVLLTQSQTCLLNSLVSCKML